MSSADPGAPDRAPGRCRGLARRPRPDAGRAGRPRWDRQLGSRPRRTPPLRPSRHGHPRSGARAHLLGALRPADQRHVPQVVPPAAALERRVPVRQVHRRRGRAAAAGGRAARSRTPTPTRSAWRSPGSSASPTGCSTSRRTGCGSAAGCPTWATGSPPTTAFLDRYAARLPELLGRTTCPRRPTTTRGARAPVATSGPAREPSLSLLLLALVAATGLLATPAGSAEVRAATPDLTIVGNARYDVQPEAKRGPGHGRPAC